MTFEDKYKFLLEWLHVRNKDLYEQDALLCMKNIYFQFSNPYDLEDMDKCVELAANDWYRNL